MKTDRITYLIFLYHTDSLSEEEEKELQEWLNINPHHQELMKRMLDAEDFSHRHAVSELFDENKAWNKFKKDIINQEKGSGSKRKFLKSFYYYISAAAVILALFVLGSNYWFSFLQHEELLPTSSTKSQVFSSNEDFVFSYDDQKEVSQTKLYSLTEPIIYMTKITEMAIPYYTVEVPKGDTVTLKLGDGSTIYLNSDSKISLPKNFHHSIREVELSYGEVYFEVAHDTLRPFVVSVGDQRVSVLGTSFVIRAYEDEPQILTTLISGKVKVKLADIECILEPGFQSVYSVDSLEVRKVDVSLYTAWRRGVFVFLNESLESIMKTLSRWYDLDVIYGSEDLKNIHLTGELKRYPTINEFLEKIECLEKVHFLVTGRTVLVSAYN